jgi:hypothetical protein
MKKKQTQQVPNYLLNRSSFTEVNLRGLGAAPTDTSRDVSFVQIDDVSFDVAARESFGIRK